MDRNVRSAAITLKIKKKTLFIGLRGNSPDAKNPAENQEIAGGF